MGAYWYSYHHPPSVTWQQDRFRQTFLWWQLHMLLRQFLPYLQLWEYWLYHSPVASHICIGWLVQAVDFRIHLVRRSSPPNLLNCQRSADSCISWHQHGVHEVFDLTFDPDGNVVLKIADSIRNLTLFLYSLSSCMLSMTTIATMSCTVLPGWSFRLCEMSKQPHCRRLGSILASIWCRNGARLAFAFFFEAAACINIDADHQWWQKHHHDGHQNSYKTFFINIFELTAFVTCSHSQTFP